MRALDDIRIVSETISTQLNHFYIGVEHLFLALLQIEDSITADILDRFSISVEVVSYQIVNQMGQASRQRYWSGFRETPRYVKVISLATDLDERGLLLAILKEGDSLPLRVLRALQIDLIAFEEAIRAWSGPIVMQEISIETGDVILSALEQKLLQRLFSGCHGLVIVSELPRYADSLRSILLSADDVLHVIRFDHPVCVAQEKYRYDVFVSHSVGREILPISGVVTDGYLGAVAYNLNTKAVPLNAHDFVAVHGWRALAWVLRYGLFDGAKAFLWGRANRYAFEFWREYDFLLPPLFVVDVKQVESPVEVVPLTGGYTGLSVGDEVVLVGFTVHSLSAVSGEMILSSGRGEDVVNLAERVLVQGVSYGGSVSFVIGQDIGRVRGVVTALRRDLLRDAFSDLETGYGDDGLWMDTPAGMLTHPVLWLDYVLSYEVEGYFSNLLGGISLEKMLFLGEDSLACFDYANARFGHTLFDWAILEFSVWESQLLPLIDDNWDTLWEGMAILYALNEQDNAILTQDSPITVGIATLASIRTVVGGLLAKQTHWEEYFGALGLIGLGAMADAKRTLKARRLGFVLAAMMFDSFYRRVNPPTP